MQPAEKFINWLEGFLDANKNKISTAQVREIRKKMKECNIRPLQSTMLLHDSSQGYSKPDSHEEFLREVEARKNAATLESLNLH